LRLFQRSPYFFMRSVRSISPAVAVLAGLLMAVGATAHEFDVIVVGPDGLPVPDVVVFVEGGDTERLDKGSQPDVVMDQLDTQFVPHMLVVQKGTAVVFPNSDTVAHHVYSFSKPNNFVLPLYKGNPHEPVVFEHDGIVTLGCNIHDDMLAYIVVVESNAFGLTDASGRVRLSVDDRTANFAVRIWSPRIRDGEDLLIQQVAAPASIETGLTFALRKRLRAPHDEATDAVAWSEY
jgi:plastocyanin